MATCKHGAGPSCLGKCTGCEEYVSILQAWKMNLIMKDLSLKVEVSRFFQGKVEENDS